MLAFSCSCESPIYMYWIFPLLKSVSVNLINTASGQKTITDFFFPVPNPWPHVEYELREGGQRPLPQWSQSEDLWFKASTALPSPPTSKQLFPIKRHSFWAQGSMLVKLSKPWFHRWRVCIALSSDVVRGAADVVTNLTLTSGGRMNWKGKK